MQAAVLHQWRRLAPKEAVATHLWVALKHEIRYRHSRVSQRPRADQGAAEKLLGACAYYKTVIDRDGEVLAVVASYWCCPDSVSKKPKRLARDIVARFLSADASLDGKGST